MQPKRRFTLGGLFSGARAGISRAWRAAGWARIKPVSDHEIRSLANRALGKIGLYDTSSATQPAETMAIITDLRELHNMHARFLRSDAGERALADEFGRITGRVAEKVRTLRGSDAETAFRQEFIEPLRKKIFGLDG